MIAAIYSRKSIFTGKGESLENQFQLCKDYSKRYLKDKNITNFLIYEDEGYSGSNTNRPAFKKLIEDAKNKKFHILICYRLDRISRNVADFSSTLKILQENNIDFISIKEQFDTTSPIGRAMIYISSVFAQLERETIAERIKDNMYELAKSGRWLGGQCPLGFYSERVSYFDENFKEKTMFKLSPNENELNIVKYIYDLYYKEKSLYKVLKECLYLNIKGKNGGNMHAMSLRDILRNPVYVKSNEEVLDYFKKCGCTTVGIPKGEGLLSYGKISNEKKTDESNWIIAVSKHKGIIDSNVWLEIQKTLDINSNIAEKRLGTSKTGLLTGLLKCSKCGSPMRISYGRSKKDGTKNYYYICTLKSNSSKSKCDNPNLSGQYIDKIIEEKLIEVSIQNLSENLIKKRKTNILPLNKLNALKEKISYLDNSINKLLSKLSESNDVVSKYIMNKINELDKEKNSYIIELKNLKVKSKDRNSINNNIFINTSNEFKSFNDLYKHCKSNKEKKLLLKSFIKEIFIDGESGETNIFYWGSKKDDFS